MIHALGHEDPRALLETTLNTPLESKVTDIYDLSPSLANQLDKAYGITTVGQLLDFVNEIGFPSAVNLRDSTKFVISYRIAHDFMK